MEREIKYKLEKQNL